MKLDIVYQEIRMVKMTNLKTSQQLQERTVCYSSNSDAKKCQRRLLMHAILHTLKFKQRACFMIIHLFKEKGFYESAGRDQPEQRQNC